jgi:hypothetical protein
MCEIEEKLDNCTGLIGTYCWEKIVESGGG